MSGEFLMPVSMLYNIYLGVGFLIRLKDYGYFTSAPLVIGSVSGSKMA
jgi:hypothetical protein